MVTLLNQSGHTAYGLQEFAVDSPEDLYHLPVDTHMGSIATVISSGSKFMLNGKGEWIEQSCCGGGAGSSAGTPGKSAYAIAVEYGFVGSETDWLASLKGEQGKSPSIGDNGHWFIGDEDTNISAICDCDVQSIDKDSILLLFE